MCSQIHPQVHFLNIITRHHTIIYGNITQSIEYALRSDCILIYTTSATNTTRLQQNTHTIYTGKQTGKKIQKKDADLKY